MHDISSRPEMDNRRSIPCVPLHRLMPGSMFDDVNGATYWVVDGSKVFSPVPARKVLTAHFHTGELGWVDYDRTVTPVFARLTPLDHYKHHQPKEA